MLIRDHYLGDINYHWNTELESSTDGDVWVYGDHTFTLGPSYSYGLVTLCQAALCYDSTFYI